MVAFLLPFLPGKPTATASTPLSLSPVVVNFSRFFPFVFVVPGLEGLLLSRSPSSLVVFPRCFGRQQRHC